MREQRISSSQTQRERLRLLHGIAQGYWTQIQRAVSG